MKDIILLGGGGHCLSCIDVIESTKQYKIKGILDTPNKVGEYLLNYPIIGSDKELYKFVEDDICFFITLGQIKTAEKRKELFNKLKELGANIPVIISPNAYISKYATIGEGTIVMHNSIINTRVKIGENCIINTQSLIEHEAMVGDNSHISTGAILNGQVKIGKEVFIGSRAVVTNNISITTNVLISAGSVLMKDVQKAGVYFGNPVRKIQ